MLHKELFERGSRSDVGETHVSPTVKFKRFGVIRAMLAAFGRLAAQAKQAEIKPTWPQTAAVGKCQNRAKMTGGQQFTSCPLGVPPLPWLQKRPASLPMGARSHVGVYLDEDHPDAFFEVDMPPAIVDEAAIQNALGDICSVPTTSPPFVVFTDGLRPRDVLLEPP